MPVWSFPYTLSTDDYLAFNEHYLRYRPSGKKAMRNCRLIFPAVLLPITLLTFLYQKDFTLLIIQLILSSVFCVLWFFFCDRFIVFTMKRRLKKKDSVENTLYSKEGLLVFDFEKRFIKDFGDKTEEKLSFDSVMVCYETNTAFYFYFSEARAVILPYVNIRTQADFLDFRNLVCQTFPVEKHNVF